MEKKPLNQRPQFAALEEYREQQAKSLEGMQMLYEQQQTEEAKLVELRSEYSRVLTESVMNRVDASEELDRIDDEIMQQEKRVERSKQQYKIFTTTNRPKLSREDVKGEFHEFTRMYKEEVVRPILDKMLEAKTLAVKAWFELMEAADYHNSIRRTLMGELNYQFMVFRPVFPKPFRKKISITSRVPRFET